jgi:hypothetical protein
VDLLQEHYPSTNSLADTYGELYDRVDSKIKELYGGCTCDSKPRGHDTWKLLGQVLNEGNDEALEVRVNLEYVHLSIGASRGDIRCECGLDLACREAFVRFVHPDTGLTSRMHYRTSTSDGNVLTE